MTTQEVRAELQTLMLQSYRNAEVAEHADTITPHLSPDIYRARAFALKEALALVESID